ncbi:MAG: hypothetical protein P4L35_01905 [Ignavibacteriaceae bacterium]|nr:hypothetical protein [Ignavibacteriaceae bacterium]
MQTEHELPIWEQTARVILQKNSSAVEVRNKSWIKNNYIPSWVEITNVGLDQFFTRPEIADRCWKSFCKFIKDAGEDLTNYKFVEPAAGLGAFYDLLPENRRVGVDVVNFRREYIQKDFLSWSPKKNGYRYACIGNPPFGYRAWLALAFVNHAAEFSDFVGFIVPMAFQSSGKSNVKDRVKGLHLVHSETLPQDSFIGADGKVLKVNALWQIWSRNGVSKEVKPATCNQYIDLFTVDMRKERLCGQRRMHEADYFLQRTFYNEPPTLVKSFSEVKYVCGYGIVIKSEKREIIKVLKNTDWRKYNNLAAHNCKHISMCHIREALTDAGFIDV